MSAAYLEYRARHRELRQLLLLGDSVQAKRPRDIALEVHLARSIVVLIAGHLEGYFNSLASEVVSKLPSRWIKLSRGQRKYVSEKLISQMSDCGKKLCDKSMLDESNVNALIAAVSAVAITYRKPNSISPRSEEIEGLYRDLAPKSVDVFLKRIHPNGNSFLDWLGTKRYDKSQICTVLQQLVSSRSDIAHGSLTQSPTLEDARRYILTAAVIVRAADRYIVT